eukprot:gene9170-12387_t
MKKTLILGFAGSLCFSAKAQTQFGVQVGGLLGNVSRKYDGRKYDDAKQSFGFKVGGLVKIPINKVLEFIPELNLVHKGGKMEATETLGEGASRNLKGTFSMMFAEIPLNLAYILKDGSGGFFAGAGPSFSFGIAGKTK